MTVNEIEELHRQLENLQQQNQDNNLLMRLSAHEIKNPLSIIIGYAQHLQRRYGTQLDKTANEFLDEINHSGFQIRDILESIQLLAHIRSAPLKLVPLDMSAVLPIAQRRLITPITLSDAIISLPTTWPTALGDSGAIEVVWLNLLKNAIQYGGRPPQIELGAQYLEKQPNSKLIRFWCRDNGPGLSEQQQQKLFTPFSARAATSTPLPINEPDDGFMTPGIGMGLYIARQVIEMHGGKIWAENTPHGAEFSFTLPGAPTTPAIG